MLKYLVVKNNASSSGTTRSRALSEMNERDDSDGRGSRSKEVSSGAKKKIAPIFQPKKKSVPAEVIDIDAEEEARERRRELRKNETSAFGGGASNPFFQKRYPKPKSASMKDETTICGSSWQRLAPFAPSVPMIGEQLLPMNIVTQEDEREHRRKKPCLEEEHNGDFYTRWINAVKDVDHRKDAIRTAVAALGTCEMTNSESTLWHQEVALVGPAANAADQLIKWLDTEWDEANHDDWDDDYLSDDGRIQSSMRATLLVGPLGSGKTAAVRSAAKRRSYEVLDVTVNSAAELQDQITEATRSKRVQHRSLILVDDLETRLCEDPAFGRVLRKIVLGTSVPVVITALIRNTRTTSQLASSLACGNIIRLTPLIDPSPVLEAQILLKAPHSMPESRHTLIRALIEAYGTDLRRAILQLQLEFSGGSSLSPTLTKRSHRETSSLPETSLHTRAPSLLVLEVTFTASDHSLRILASTSVPYIILDGLHCLPVVSAVRLPQGTFSLEARIPKHVLPQGSFVEVILLADDGRSSPRTANASAIFEYETELPVTTKPHRLRKAFGRRRRRSDHSAPEDTEEDLEFVFDSTQPEQQRLVSKRRRVALDDDDDNDDDDKDANEIQNDATHVSVTLEDTPAEDQQSTVIPLPLPLPQNRIQIQVRDHPALAPTLAVAESNSVIDAYGASLYANSWTSDTDDVCCTQTRTLAKRKRRLVDALDVAATDNIFAPRASRSYIATDFAPTIQTIVASEAKRAEHCTRRRFHHHFNQHHDAVDAFTHLLADDEVAS